MLADGTVGLVHELAWFEDLAAQRGLRLDAERQPATTAYGHLLTRLDAAPVAEALVALWAIERADLDAWSFAAPRAPAYRPFVAHWTTPEFVAYVTRLQCAADAATGPCPQGSEAVFTDVARGVPLLGHGTRRRHLVSVAARLWDENGDLPAAGLDHPFVRGLADGTLPQQAFAGYLAQDTFFLESFARAYALALAHSPDRQTLDSFADLLDGVRGRAAAPCLLRPAAGIDLSTVEPSAATLAYTDFLRATAALGGIARTCAAMTPCMRLYAHLGTSLAAHTHTGYDAWITTYADPEFERLAVRLAVVATTWARGTACPETSTTAGVSGRQRS